MATKAKKSRGKSMRKVAKKSSVKSRGGRAASAKAAKKSARRVVVTKKKVVVKKRTRKKTVKKASGRSPLARVKRVAREVAAQATTAVTAGVETLKGLGESIVERVETVTNPT